MKKNYSHVQSKFKSQKPVFHVQSKKEEESSLSIVMVQQARKSGKLNLSGRNLTAIPKEIFNLGDAHSFDNDVNLEHKENDRWWEMEPLNYLDVSSNCINNIPREINRLDTLMVFNLHSNNLASLPAEIGHLFKLTKLDLAHNKLTDLPIDMSGLKELRTLNASYNQFKSVPDCVYDLVMLNQLDLSNNVIAEMPPGIGFLTRLTHFNISHNSLVSVPNDIGNLKSVVDLDLSHNKITSDELPPLGELVNVQFINLQYNQLTLLPKIDGCAALKEIHLNNNKMEEITIEELSTLSHLQIINLRDNKLKKLPKEMSCLQNLIRLDLTNNDLKELPATLALLPHLQNLLIEGNALRAIRRDLVTGGTQRLLKHLKETIPLTEEDKQIISKLPCTVNNEFPDRFSMRSSKSLNLASQDLCTVPDKVFEEALEVPCSMVDLSGNKLKEVPQKMWSLGKYLTDINLSKNHIVCLPVSIGDCINLQYLNLEGNQLTSLPDELSNCCKLREINLSYNKFTQIPTCLFSIVALEILLCRDNKIVEVNIEGLKKLKYLATLDLNNNNIAVVPPLLGTMTQIRSLGLDGNGLRNPSPAILAKGTDSILSWLRNKIPA